jgi:hypothetical protein
MTSLGYRLTYDGLLAAGFVAKYSGTGKRSFTHRLGDLALLGARDERFHRKQQCLRCRRTGGKRCDEIGKAERFIARTRTARSRCAAL